MAARKRKRTQKKASSPRRNRWVFYVALLSSVGVVVYVLGYTRFVELQAHTITGTQAVAASALHETVVAKLSHVTALGISGKNYFVLDTAALEQQLLEAFPQIEAVHVTKHFPDALEIAVTEYDALVVWCPEERREGCMLLDRYGKTRRHADFAQAPLAEQDYVIVEGVDEAVKLGDVVIAEDVLARVVTVGEELRYLSQARVDPVYDLTARAAEEAVFTSTDGYTVTISTQQDAEDTLRVLRTFFGEEHVLALSGRLEYVDARFRDRVFYKVRGGAASNTAHSAESDTESDTDSNTIPDAESIVENNEEVSTEQELISEQERDLVGGE